MTRSKPFSAKQKKDQIKAKRELKRVEAELELQNDNLSLYDKRALARSIITSKDSSNSKSNNNNSKVNNNNVKNKRNQGNINNRNKRVNRVLKNHNRDSSNQDDDDDSDDDNVDEDTHSTELSDSNLSSSVVDDEDDESDQDEDEEEEEDSNDDDDEEDGSTTRKSKEKRNVKVLNQQIKANDQLRDNKQRTRLNLVTIFEKETREEIERRKEIGKQPLDMSLRDKPWEILNDHQFKDVNNNQNNNESNENNYIDIPKRPKWEYGISSQEEKDRERIMYKKWMDNIVSKYNPSRLNYFEHNLEVWRQLWRVCERSDIILLVTDARYPLFHFPPALYNYIINELRKPMLLVLNKVDLVDKRIVESWIEYFNNNYPEVKVICFSSFRPLDSETAQHTDTSKRRKFKRGRKNYEMAGGKKSLIEAILSFGIKKDSLDLTELIEKLKQQNPTSTSKSKEKQVDSDDDEEEDDSDDSESEEESEDDDENQEEKDEGEEEGEGEFKDKPKDNCITVGTVGHPNVGKSSLINGLMGRKVVSTSRTPGHTKHFQTIFLAKGIVLCDCPGLVFPALDRPKPLQVLCGLYPIAQVREPYSAIRYLADRVPIERVYGLENPSGEHNKSGKMDPWSPYLICEAFAYKRGYLIAKSGRADVHRAGLEILKDCVDGNIVISWPPPNITKEKYEQIMSTSNLNVNQQQQQQRPIKEKDTDQHKSNAMKRQEKKEKQKKKLNRIVNNLSDDEWDEDQEEEEDQSVDEKIRNRVRKQIKDVKIESTTSTTLPTNQPTNKHGKGKNKKNNSKSLDYQERLAEKQKKGGNHRQVV